MVRSPQPSSAALAAGIPARYVYWFGRSGRRVLFTATDRPALADLSGAVVIAVRAGAIIWAGECEALMRAPRTAWLCGAELYVHLLAAGPGERRALVEDFRPAERESVRLAA